MRVAVIIGIVLAAVACNGRDADAPSGACEQDEQQAIGLYGPPLGVSMNGNVTTYTWGAGVGTFTASGSSCTEAFT